MPLRRWRKFRATRSPFRMLAKLPVTLAALLPGLTLAPSSKRSSTFNCGSTCWKTCFASPVPARIPSSLITMKPTPGWCTDIKAAVVTSPWPRSSAKARSMTSSIRCLSGDILPENDASLPLRRSAREISTKVGAPAFLAEQSSLSHQSST